MKIKSGKEDAYKGYVAINQQDEYSARVVSFGEDWANLMEVELAKGTTIMFCAKSCSHEADTDGITGFMYGCAVSALSEFWEYGEELRLWHNLDTQIGKEGEVANKFGGVLNPAILVLGDEHDSLDN